MKDIRGVGIAVFGALSFAAFAAKAETVVWYTFDDLGDVGTRISDSSTIQNKANPGTHNATVYGIRNGYILYPESVHLPYVTNGVPEFTRIWNPVSGTSASSADQALRFPATNAAGQGALLEVETDASLRPESFTAEALFRYPENINLDTTGWNRLVVMPNDAGYAWEIVVRWHNQIGFHFMANDGSVTNRDWVVAPASGNFNDGQWHHVALSVEQGETTSTVKMYLDYALKATKTLNYRISYSSSNLPIQIGARSEQGCLGNFCGELGEFRFSNTTLTPAQFLRPRSMAAQTNFDPDCVLYYDFEDFTEDWSWFAAGVGDVVNKANPGVMSGTFVTRNDYSPEIVAESPAERLRQSMLAATYENSSKALQNRIGDNQRQTGYLMCTPLDDDWLSKTNFTIETYFKTSNQAQPYVALFQRFGGTNVQLKFGINGGGTSLGINISTNTTDQIQKDWYTIPKDEWHHAALVVNQTGEDKKIDLFIDGLRKSGMALDANLTSLDKDGMTHNGTWYFAGATGNSFDGTIDSMRVTLRALEPQEFLTARPYGVDSTISHISFDDATANASSEYGALKNGKYRGTAPTYSDDVPGALIRDGVDGELLTKHNAKSISFPDTTDHSWVSYGSIDNNPFDTHYLHTSTNGQYRTSGTIEFWMKSSQTDADYDTVLVSYYTRRIVDDKATSYQSILIRFNNAHKLEFGFSANGTWRVVTAASVDVLNGKWHHVAFTFKPAPTDPAKMVAACFIDHAQVETQTCDGPLLLENDGYFDLRFAGQHGGNFGKKNYGGLIDELRISDCALEPSQFLRAEHAPGLSIIVR